VNCPGGGSYTTDDELVVDFDDCELFRGEPITLNGELELPFAFSSGAAQGPFEFFDLEATLRNREIEINGEFAGQVTSAATQISIDDVVINDNGTTTTIEGGALRVLTDDSGRFSQLMFSADIEFEQFSNTTYSVVITPLNGETTTCIGNGTILIDSEDGPSLTATPGSGDNFTFEIGDNIETVNCSEIPRLLGN